MVAVQVGRPAVQSEGDGKGRWCWSVLMVKVDGDVLVAMVNVCGSSEGLWWRWSMVATGCGGRCCWRQTTVMVGGDG